MLPIKKNTYKLEIKMKWTGEFVKVAEQGRETGLCGTD